MPSRTSPPILPPPNTHTPASFASCTTAREASDTAGSSAGDTTIALLGNEISCFVNGSTLSTPGAQSRLAMCSDAGR